MRSKQKGQAMVELAFVLPFLLFFLLWICYLSMMLSDFLMLNNYARNAARAASVVATDQFPNIKKTYTKEKVPFDFYVIDNVSVNPPKKGDTNVSVIIYYHLNEDCWIEKARRHMGYSDSVSGQRMTYNMYYEYGDSSS